MKVNVCDVCWYENNGKMVKSEWNISNGNKLEKIKLTTCNEHKLFLKGLTLEQAREKVHNLLTQWRG